VRDEWLRILILLPEHTYDNDIERKPLAPEERVEITL
jgi:hypothetical protein